MIYFVVYSVWVDEDRTDTVWRARLEAESLEEARRIARANRGAVIACSGREDIDIHDVEVTVRTWDEWGRQLDKNWELIRERSDANVADD